MPLYLHFPIWTKCPPLSFLETTLCLDMVIHRIAYSDALIGSCVQNNVFTTARLALLWQIDLWFTDKVYSIVDSW